MAKTDVAVLIASALVGAAQGPTRLPLSPQAERSSPNGAKQDSWAGYLNAGVG